MSNIATNTVLVIDGITNDIVADVPVGNNPDGLAVNPINGRIYVTNIRHSTVSVIDGTTNVVIATVRVGTFPLGVGVNPATNRVYVANYTSGNVSVIDGKTNAVVATVPVGSWPYGVSVNPITNRIYVANSDSDNVSVIADYTVDSAIGSLIADVQQFVDEGVLSDGGGHSLITKLENALKLLTDDNDANDVAAVHQILAFINEVRGLMNGNNPVLTSAQGQPLIVRAEAIADAILG